MTRVAIYARYSSDQQNERSIADQVAILTRHAEAKGWTIVGVHTDAAISGASMATRPGLLNALAAADRGEYDRLLVEDEDRLARNLEHLAHIANRLEDVGAAIATLSSDRVEGMMVAFKGGMAQDFIRNLSQKTARGMASNAAQGLATGSRLYGYRSEPGGAVSIVPDQAEIIRRIFALYADGELTPREIAALLNREGIPSPSGRQWNASTINGSAQRANGILHSEIYAGTKVFGRVEMRKDRRTGKRQTIIRPASDHVRVPVPHLAIVPPDLWTRTQARLLSRRTLDPATRVKLSRPKSLLSGLTKCGRCGGSYTSLSHGRLVCSAYRERGTEGCSNRRHVGRAEIERRVLEGLRTQLMAPAAVAAYVRAYHAAWQAAAAQQADQRRPLERRLGEVERAIARGVDALMSGALTSTAVAKKIEALEAEQAELTATLAAIEDGPSPAVQLHPRAADAYADRIATLEQSLAAYAAGTAPAGHDVISAVRDMIDRIEITPESDERRAPVQIALWGRLADFSALVDRSDPLCGGRVVAGGGIEPPTCGL